MYSPKLALRLCVVRLIIQRSGLTAAAAAVVVVPVQPARMYDILSTHVRLLGGIYVVKITGLRV